MDQDFDLEEPMTADARKVRGDLCAFYAIPEQSLLTRVPLVLQMVDDHVVFPFSPLWPSNLYVRVSNFDTLKKVCYNLRNILLNKTLMVYIMPYMSTSDAHELHQLILNPGRITIPSADDAHGQHLPIRGRHGMLTLTNPHDPDDDSSPTLLNFVVLNYGVLWAKATEYVFFIGTVKQAKEMISQIEDHQHRIMDDPAVVGGILSDEYLTNLEDTTEHKKLDFVLSLHRNGIDPHAAILAIDAELHEELYDVGYDPFYPHDRTDAYLVDLTRNSVEMYMMQLENSGHDVQNFKEAEWEVLKAEGFYEAQVHRQDAIRQFSKAIDTCKEDLMTAVNQMNNAAKQPSLIGVIGRDTRLM